MTKEDVWVAVRARRRGKAPRDVDRAVCEGTREDE